MNRLLTAILTIMLVLCLVVIGCQALNGEISGVPKIGKPAPNFQLPNLYGKSVSLSDLHGKPVILNFWATGCRPCVYEMPYFQEIFKEWSDRGLVVLAINQGEPLSRVEKFMQDWGLSFPVLLDANMDVAEKYNVRGLPTTFLIDKDGIIQAIKIGAFRAKWEIGGLNKIIP